jgi:16S rRNA (cytosine1402-N4)-methyltransferase
MKHEPVLLEEILEHLRPNREDGTLVDATVGLGGHAEGLLDKYPRARLLAIDRDPEALQRSRERLSRFGDRVTLVRGRHESLIEILKQQGIGQVSGLLADLGVSSMQLDDAARGFSFRFDGPLDMRMDPTRGESAADFLARADERLIAEVIKNYGEERFALSVAKALVARRESGNPVRTTAQLSEVVAGAVKTREPGQNPATRTFQALRIFVNAELEELEQGLSAALDLLLPGGRLVVISFHSLEDRIVKTFIGRESKSVFDRRAPFAEPKPSRLKALGRVKPSDAEVDANPRSRSAVMRVAERTEVAA